ncbi:MAG: kelch repeat-containing protein [Minicystis sp.]
MQTAASSSCIDGAGIPRLRVTAPAAYAADGRAIGVHLRAHDTTVELYVDPTSDAVLVDPQWVSTGTMNVARITHAAAKLGDGRVLVTGGYNGSGYTATAEIYDPATGAWTLTNPMLTARGRHTMTTLPNGKVLVVGGWAGLSSYAQGTEIYDPATGTFSTGPSLSQRVDHAATLLNDGKVLISGGNSGLAVLQDTYLYDATTNTITSSGLMPHLHQSHRATVMADGRVLVVGCYSNGNDYQVMIASDLFNPATGVWTVAGSPLWPHYAHPQALLPDGRVIAAGGEGFSMAPHTKTEIYNPATNTWSLVAQMSIARDRPISALLGDGTLLVAGGYDGVSYPTTLATAERYDPVSNTWSSAGSMANSHYDAVSATLDNGYVLVAGGTTNPYFTYTGLSELYTTLAGNGAACSSASQCVSGNCVDGVCCNSACGGGVTTDCQACSTAAGASQNGTCGAIYTGTCALASGAACTASSQCGSGFCVDGVCCNSACGGGVTTDCQACSVATGASQDGTCTTLTTGSCGLSPNGAACSASNQCSSGFCVDGVCCNTACGGGANDCQACSVAAGASQDGTCTALTTGSCGTTCLTIQRGTSGTVADAHIVSSSGTTNYGANAVLSAGGTSGATRYALLNFDLSAIPQGSVVTQATVTLSTFSGGGATVNFHRITAPWSESTVTWNSFASAFNAQVEAAITGNSTSYSGDVSALVQAWVNGTYSNYGMLLERDLSAATGLYASEFATVSSRPKLYVCYHP